MLQAMQTPLPQFNGTVQAVENSSAVSDAPDTADLGLGTKAKNGKNGKDSKAKFALESPEQPKLTGEVAEVPKQIGGEVDTTYAESKPTFIDAEWTEVPDAPSKPTSKLPAVADGIKPTWGGIKPTWGGAGAAAAIGVGVNLASRTETGQAALNAFENYKANNEATGADNLKKTAQMLGFDMSNGTAKSISSLGSKLGKVETGVLMSVAAPVESAIAMGASYATDKVVSSADFFKNMLGGNR